MIVIVNPHEIVLKKEEDINEKEINISKCNFKFDEQITDDFVKEAIFIKDEKAVKKVINNNECDYPSEILDSNGTCLLGVVATLTKDNEMIKRFNPTPKKFIINKGTLRPADNSQPITPSEFEQYKQFLQNKLNELKVKVNQVVEIGNAVSEQGTYAQTQGDYAKEQGKQAETIATTVQKKLDNGEFVGQEGPQGPQGPKGDCNFATFDIDLEKGDLIMNKPDSISQIDFALNKINGNLEVITNV